MFDTTVVRGGDHTVRVTIANENKLAELKLSMVKNKAFVDFWW